ncbi:MAG: nucleotidyltransferase [Fervidicoccaceae archaeon]
MGILESLKEVGIKFIVIGDLVLELYLKRPTTHDDLDLFVIEPDPLVEEEIYRELAAKLDFEFETTWAGTPRLSSPSEGFAIDFYSNVLEFEMPPKFLDELEEWNIRGVSFESVNLEQQTVLKARACMVYEEHAQELRDSVESLGLTRALKRKKLEEYVDMLSEDSRKVVRRLLKELRALG